MSPRTPNAEPHPLESRPRRRGTIRLGPGGWLYFVVSALLYAASQYTQANLLFAAFGLMVGGAAVSLLWSAVTLRGLRVRRILPEYGVAGRATTLRYEITNGSKLPVFSVVVGEARRPSGRWWKDTWRRWKWRKRTPAEAWVVHIGPGQTATVEAPAWLHRRGPWHMHGVVVWSAFPFGVFRKVARLDLPARLLVLPELHRLDPRLLQSARRSEGAGTKQRDRAGAHGEFFGLRNYRLGDPPRLIDWKRTAKQGRLVARELAQPSPPRVVVLLDLAERDADAPGANRRRKVDHPTLGSDAEEDAIALVASLVCEGYLQAYCMGLMVRGPACGTFASHHSRLHRMRLLEALASLDLSSRETLPDAGLVRPSLVVRARDGQPVSDGVNDGVLATTPAPPMLSAYHGVRVIDASALRDYALPEQAVDLSQEPARGGGNGSKAGRWLAGDADEKNGEASNAFSDGAADEASASIAELADAGGER